MGFFREFRYEVSTVVFGLGILSMVFALTQAFLGAQSPDWLKGVHTTVGGWVIWEGTLGFFALLGGGYYFVDTIVKDREFNRLLSTRSKEVFVKNLERLERLVYYELPSAYERRLNEKKHEFRIKG
jgi:hypothetical protein